MHEYPVWDLFEEIGKVRLAEEGLYLTYEAAVQSDRPGFLRLYHHRGDAVCRLGLFSETDGVLSCKGRISLRSLGTGWENGSFSIQDTAVFPLSSPLDGGYLPQNALEYWKDGRRFVAVRRDDRLPEEILPFFCFLRPETVADTSCLVLEVDIEGRPLIQ